MEHWPFTVKNSKNDKPLLEVKYKNEYAREVTIQQLDHQGGEVYTCVLSEAFPTTVNVIELNNDQDGLVLVNVQLAFTDWR